MLKVYAAVHASSAPPAGPVISLATQAALPGGWVIAPTAVSTHAFLVLEHVDGLRWRLDGQPPRAVWAPSDTLATDGLPSAVWRFTPPTQRDVDLAAAHARALGGVAYDFAEIAAQGAAAAQAVARRVLPWGLRLPGVGRVDLLRGAMICTRVVVEALSAARGAPAEALRAMPDLFPERLGSVLRAAEGVWTQRVL